MRRRKQPDPGGTAASSKFRPRTESRSQSADGVEADRGSKAATPVTRSLDPSRRRVNDEAARSTDTSTRQVASGLATEDHTLEASPSRPTVSPGGRGAADDVPSAADADQLPTVAPTVAETRLSTRSKSSMLGGEADTAPLRECPSVLARQKETSASRLGEVEHGRRTRTDGVRGDRGAP